MWVVVIVPHLLFSFSFTVFPQDFDLRSTLSEYVCGPKCPYYQGLHPIGARANGLQYNAAAIPRPLAEEVAEFVHAKFYQLRIRKVPLVTLTERQIAAFHRGLHNIGQGNEDGNEDDSMIDDANADDNDMSAAVVQAGEDNDEESSV